MKEMKEKFLKEVGEEKPFPAPQVFNDDSYCGVSFVYLLLTKYPDLTI